MKKLLSILLLFAILLQSFSKVFVVFSFKINQKYITEVFCINRNQPTSTCNGKCFLMQKLKAEEAREQKELPQKIKKIQDFVYVFYPNEQLLNCSRQVLFFFSRPFATIPICYSFSAVKGIFHPPCA